jgi:ankyrin repeat protein
MSQTHILFETLNDYYNDRISLDKCKSILRYNLDANKHNINNIYDNKYLKGDTVLLFAIRYKVDISIIEILLEDQYNIDPNKDSEYGIMPLNLSILGFAYGLKKNSKKCYNYEVIKLLLDRGANPNCKNHNGMTPLCYLCMFIHLVFMYCVYKHMTEDEHQYKVNMVSDILSTLLKRGADPNITDNNNHTPLYYLCEALNNKHDTYIRMDDYIQTIIYLLLYYGMNIHALINYEGEVMTSWEMVLASEIDCIKNVIENYYKNRELSKKMLLMNTNLPPEIIQHIIRNIYI